jgi:DHA2 family multidrug resistance protein
VGYTDGIDDLFARYGPTYRWLATATGLLAFFTMAFSSTIVNVAVPDVMGAYGVGQDQAQFLATSFFATMTASQLVTNWVSQRFGQRLTFTGALLLFSFGSVVSGIGLTFEFVISGRIMQGFAAGILQPLVMLMLFQVFPPERRGLAMGLFSMGIVAAIGVGPYIGGLTIDHLSWRYIFLAPMPPVILAFFMGFFFVPSIKSADQSVGFDWIGYVFLCISLFCLMTGIANGQREGWASNEIVALFVISVLTGSGFVFSQFRTGAGLLDMSLFRNRQFAITAVIALLFGYGNFSTMYIFPVFSQLVQEYTATLAGLLIMPGSLLAMLVLPLTGRLSDMVSPQFPIILGLLIFSISMLFMTGADIDTAIWSVGFFIFIGRLGIAFVVPSMNVAALATLPAEKISRGAGAVNFLLLLGGSCGINSLVVVMEQRTQHHSDLLAATQTAGNAATREMLVGVHGLLGEVGVSASLHGSVALDYLGKVIHAQANTLGFQDGFMALAFVFLFAIIPALILAWPGRR